MHDGGARATGLLRSRVVVVGFLVAVLTGAIAGRFVFLAPPAPLAAAGTEANELGRAEEALAADPDDPSLLSAVGSAALKEARRTANPAFYAQAAAVTERALGVAPDDVQSLVTAGLLALARHDFDGALVLAERARASAPRDTEPLAVQIDALTELGRYDEAVAVAEDMVARRPSMSSLPRLSYVLELTGQADAALEVMQQAVAAGGDRGEEAAYVLTLLGDLHLQAGRLDAAAAVYRRAERAQPGQPQAALGRARVAVDRGDLAAASRELQRLTDRLPLPEAVALYSDVLMQQGDIEASRRQRALVRAIETLNRTTGSVDVDLELARFEAAHARLADGDPTNAVVLAEAARASRPTIYGDDVLAWALRQAGRAGEALPAARAATRYDTADATLWWHRAAIEADLGLLDAARSSLARSEAIGGQVALVERDEHAALVLRLGR